MCLSTRYHNQPHCRVFNIKSAKSALLWFIWDIAHISFFSVSLESKFQKTLIIFFMLQDANTDLIDLGYTGWRAYQNGSQLLHPCLL